MPPAPKPPAEQPEEVRPPGDDDLDLPDLKLPPGDDDDVEEGGEPLEDAFIKVTNYGEDQEWDSLDDFDEWNNLDLTFFKDSHWMEITF